ncbi:MAG: hypothetical protein WD734_05215, partial [Dehalococcoidia bacterium]
TGEPAVSDAELAEVKFVSLDSLPPMMFLTDEQVLARLRADLNAHVPHFPKHWWERLGEGFRGSVQRRRE